MPKKYPNDTIYFEIIRRLPKHKCLTIEDRLDGVTPTHISLLSDTMASPKNLLDDTSFIHDEMFPFTALHAVRIGDISPLQFGTIMALWGNLENILPRLSKQADQAIPEYVPLFTETMEINPRARILLAPSLENPTMLPNLLLNTPEEILRGIYDKAIHLPQSEQGFWIIEDSTSSAEGPRTITQEIKSLDVKFLTFKASERLEMIPSFGLQQIFLEVAFPHAVRINPVIGDSTPHDIRKGSIERYRDIALPFPGNELPKVADNFSAPSALHFLFHDRYHAIRASRVTPEETAHYVAIGDNLETIQKHFNSAVIELSRRHEEHIRLLPEFSSFIEKLPESKKREVIEVVCKKFNHEKAIIGILKKTRKSLGQLKFRLWDMERAASGSLLDTTEKTALKDLIRMIMNVEVDLGILRPNKFVGHRAAHAFLEAVKPEATTLLELQEQCKTARRTAMFLLTSQPIGIRAFDDVILDAPPPSYERSIVSI